MYDNNDVIFLSVISNLYCYLLIIIVQTLHLGFRPTTRYVFNAIKTLYRIPCIPIITIKTLSAHSFQRGCLYRRPRENRYCFFFPLYCSRSMLFFMVGRHKGSRTGFIYEDSRRAIVFCVQYLWTYKVSVRF